MRKVVGMITEQEKVEIRNLYNHKTGLEELIPILDKNSDTYRKAVSDLKGTIQEYTSWWRTYAEKYHWEKGKKEWTVIFKTNEIVIEE